ncbi:MAG TPA: asparagine synthase-related protein [Solirubrobacterales bacterium]
MGGGSETPSRSALACGALGNYDHELVRRIATHVAEEMSVAHEDDHSILMLDRPAIRWRGRGRGFAWSEGGLRHDRVTLWKGASVKLAACGLVVQDRRRRVHSSVSGIAPVYHLEHDGAVYFASRIDPLVRALPPRLTIDWRAWASIFYLRFPLGERTPFLEVKRLRPFSTLEWDETGQRRRTVEHRWPWAQIEPHLDLDPGAEAVTSAIREAIAPLEAGPVTCTLSGGWDSRLLLCLLAEHGNDVRALTVKPDNGHDREQELAAGVAATLGVPHSTVEGRVEEFWADTRERALRVDYQLAAPPWAMPLAAALKGLPGQATDGLGLDTLAQAGTTHYSESMIRPDGTAAIAQALWTRLLGQVMRHATGRVLAPALDEELKALARRQFMAEANRFRGHPAEVVLTFYATRTVRGISLTPNAILGADMATVTPCTDDRVVTALLETRPLEKFHARIYRALFDQVNPTVGDLPSTHERQPAPAITRPRRGLSRSAVRGYERVLVDGPLERILGDEVRERLAQGTLAEGLAEPAFHRGVLAVTLLHLWHERYRDRLAGDDPLGELAGAKPGAGASRAAATSSV